MVNLRTDGYQAKKNIAIKVLCCSVEIQIKLLKRWYTERNMKYTYMSIIYFQNTYCIFKLHTFTSHKCSFIGRRLDVHNNNGYSTLVDIRYYIFGFKYRQRFK